MESPERLNAPNGEILRRFLERQAWNRAAAVELERLTVGAAVELACAAWTWRRAQRGAEANWVAHSTHPFLGRASAALAGQGDVVAYLERSADEFQPVQNLQQIAIISQRFKMSLVKRAALAPTMAAALAGTLQEMLDNVLEHSLPTRGSPAPAVAAYQVEPGAMTFAVGDVGQGVLASLRTRDLYASLSSHQMALTEILANHATSRPDGAGGTGFRTLFRHLADRKGVLSFRSGDARQVLDGSHPGPRTWIEAASLPMEGFQLEVTCQL